MGVGVANLAARSLKSGVPSFLLRLLDEGCGGMTGGVHVLIPAGDPGLDVRVETKESGGSSQEA